MAETTRIISIYNDPESKVHFLETLLDGKDWSANIIISDKLLPANVNKQQYAKTLEAKFNKEGFSSEIKQDEHGHVLLHLHHIGDDTSFHSTIEKMGLVKGAGYTLTHLGAPLSKALSQAYNYAEYIIKEPARLFSGIFLLGDVMLIASGAKAKGKADSGHFIQRQIENIKALKNPENALQSTAGILALMQSLIFIKYASNGSELAYDELKTRFNAGKKTDIDPLNVSQWASDNNASSSSFTAALKRHPIEAGALSQIFGQVAFAGANLIDLKKKSKGHAHTPEEIKGLHFNIMSAFMSISSWFMFMKNPVHHEQKAYWQSAPITRGWQEFEEHPERFASITTAAASMIGLWGAIKKGNKPQQYAEGLWLIGDAVLFFTKKNHYGNVAARLEEPMIQAATQFISEIPLALGGIATTQFVKDLSKVLAEKSIKENMEKKHIQLSANDFKKQTTELSTAIEMGVHDNLAKNHSHYDKLINQSARLIERFENNKRDDIAQALSASISSAKGVYASKEEIADSLKSAINTQLSIGTSPPLTLKDLLPNIRTIVSATGSMSAPFIGLAVYEAIAPHILTSRNDIEFLNSKMHKNDNIVQKAADKKQSHSAAIRKEQAAQGVLQYSL